MTPGQQRAFDEGWSRWGLQYSSGLLEAEKVFSNAHPLVMEIGFGMGQSLIAMAAENPERNFIGIEVHTPGVGKLFHGLQERGLENVRVYRHDAVEVLRDCLADNSLHTVQIFFPDPWHKKRHRKRRLIQPEFVQAMRPKLKPGGLFHLATDWEHYAEQMMDVLSNTEGFENRFPCGQFAPRPEHRPKTKFETRGERLGHSVWDLQFQRSA